LRSWALWLLGYPAAAIADVERAIADARDVGQTATLTYALSLTGLTRVWCGDFKAAIAQSDELVHVAGEKGGPFWKAFGLNIRGSVLSLTAKPYDAIEILSSASDSSRPLGAMLWYPYWSSMSASAYADIGKFDDAWRLIGEAISTIEKTKERWAEAEVNRIGGEITLKSPEHDAAKAEAFFERALTVARAQQAKSWELRAAMSMARLWRGQGKREEARELLAPVYGWFTEGFDTLDLKEAKTLLEA
jgi:predicted ATPase